MNGAGKKLIAPCSDANRVRVVDHGQKRPNPEVDVGTLPLSSPHMSPIQASALYCVPVNGEKGIGPYFSDGSKVRFSAASGNRL